MTQIDHPTVRLLLVLACLAGPIACPAQDEPASTASEDAAEAEPGAWERARTTAGNWWDEAFSSDTSFADVWQEVLPKLEDTLALEDRQSKLPESAWFGEDQESNLDEINGLLDEALGILAVSPLQNYRGRIRELEEDIVEARADIARFRSERVSAPESAALKRTVSDYDDLIDDRNERIARHEEELAEIKRTFAEELRATGLQLEDEQVEFLLSTVVGDNMVDLGIVFDNVRAITEQLETLVVESGEDLQAARRYYGMYVVVLKAFNRMHVQIEEAIDEDYLPRIDAIAEEADRLGDETRKLMRSAPDRRELLQSNLEAQQLTIEAAGFYRGYLEEQREQVVDAREALEVDIATAWNTYETVRVSGELVGLVRSSQRLLEGLMNRQVPALRPFENLEMKREMEKLTVQLRGS